MRVLTVILGMRMHEYDNDDDAGFDTAMTTATTTTVMQTVYPANVAVIGGSFYKRKTSVGKKGVCTSRCPGYNFRGWHWKDTNGVFIRNCTINQI